MSNKGKGHSAESRYMYGNWLFRYSGSRYYASLGLFDCIFVDKNLVTRLVQCKFSSRPGKKPIISRKEIFDLKLWVEQNCLKGVKHIWVGYVLMKKYGEQIEVRL